jgi:ribonuclease Z
MSMAKIIILGSSNAVSDGNHENTHMVIVGEEKRILVDCPSSPIGRLKLANVEFNAISDLIITHFHPDHVSGVPMFLMEMWLMGRSSPLKIYGLDYTISRLEKMLDLFEWKNWPGFYPVSFIHLAEEELTRVLDDSELAVFSSPVKHLIPDIGLRVEFSNGKVFAYSSDTEPCEQVIRLASNANTLVHEASGAGVGHSSAEQAGQIAMKAGVSHLYLIHYPTGSNQVPNLVKNALAHFNGKVDLAEDFTTLEF